MLKTHETEGRDGRPGFDPSGSLGYARSHGDGVRRDALRV